MSINNQSGIPSSVQGFHSEKQSKLFENIAGDQS